MNLWKLLLVFCLTNVLTALGPMTVTVYHAVPKQTDSTPLQTADGTVIVPSNIPTQRIAAVSQDMLKRNGGNISYGDRIYVLVDDPILQGVWNVHDTMATEYEDENGNTIQIERFVDLLVPEYTYLEWNNVQIYLIEEEDNVIRPTLSGSLQAHVSKDMCGPCRYANRKADSIR